MKTSTLNLLFGHATAYQRQGNGQYEAVKDIFEIVVDSRYKSTYEGNEFTKARFWRSVCTRFWQRDDFTFPGIAAASYLGNAHRFKIWFNPAECYKFLTICAMDLFGHGTNQESVMEKAKGLFGRGKKKMKAMGSKKNTEEDRQTELAAADVEWEALINGKSKHEKRLRSNYGWDLDFWKMLEKCAEEGTEWSEEAWFRWNHLLVNNDYFNANVTAIMIHEMQHIIWNHLGRVGKRDPSQWNLATDYAINQCLSFTPEVRKACITSDNETFFGRYVLSYVRYLLMKEPDIRKGVKKKYKLSIDQDIQEFVKVGEKHINDLFHEFMCDSDGWHVDKTANKAADFYYRILEETMIFTGGGGGQGQGQGRGQGQGSGDPQDGEGGNGVRGYNDHKEWSEVADDSECNEGDEGDEGGDGKGSGDGDNDKDGKNGSGDDKKKDRQQGGKNDQSRKAAKGNDAKSGGGGSSQGGADSKERGKGEGEGAVHAGWDVTAACSRQEVKSAVRDSLKRAGFNPDNPGEIERALNRTPGMESLGAYITDWFKVPTKNWKQILAAYVATAINPQDMDYTMSRENRRLPGMFPGKRRERGIDLIVGVDTSGSISHTDYNDFVNQIERIVRDCDVDKVRMIQCHHSIAFDKKVKLRNIKKIPICETGGTTMRCIYEKLKQEHNRKLLILFTDGCIDHFMNDGWGFKSIMFLSRGNECYAQDLRDRDFTVVCQDQE